VEAGSVPASLTQLMESRPIANEISSIETSRHSWTTFGDQNLSHVKMVDAGAFGEVHAVNKPTLEKHYLITKARR